MSASPSHPSRKPSRSSGWRDRGWVFVLGLALAWVAWDASRTVTYYERASALYGVAVRAPEYDPASPTGLADGRRTFVYPGNSLDGLHWIVQTQQMFARGEWRVRHSPEDNAPEGREVHWGSPFRWWLGACAWIDHRLSGRPLGLAAEHAGLWANPALFGLFLVVTIPWVARVHGSAAAACLAFAMVGTPGFSILFASNNPDHHGLIQVLVMGCLFGVVTGGAGWFREDNGANAPDALWVPGLRSARIRFMVSGVLGGMGMWVSAASTIPALAGIAAGALLAARLGRGPARGVRYDARLWARWGRVGAAASLAAYVVEYAPAHFGWHLEVNHPAYALAWLGAGELLAVCTAAMHEGSWHVLRRQAPRLLVAGAVAMLPAIILLVGGVRVFAVRDSLIWAMSHQYTPEGRGLLKAVAISGWNLTTLAMCLPMASVLIIAAEMTRSRIAPLGRAAFAVPLTATVIFWGMSFIELRWWTVAFGFLFAVVVVAIRLLGSGTFGRRSQWVAWTVGVVVFVPGALDTLREEVRRPAIAADDIISLAERDLAHALRQRVGTEPLVVLSAPATTSRLIYFASAHGLGTPYWENAAGLHRAAAIFAAPDGATARALAEAARVTHIVLLSWDDFVSAYVRLHRLLAPTDPIGASAFGLELQTSDDPPPWLRRVHYNLPNYPAFRSARVRIFEVTDRVGPGQVLVRRVNDRLYDGDIRGAGRLLPELRRLESDLGAQVARARIAAATKDTVEFTASLERIEPLLAQSADLEAEDGINLASLLAQAGLTTRARQVLGQMLEALDERSLRRLSAGALMDLLASAEALQIPWPRAELRDRAIALVPPDGAR